MYNYIHLGYSSADQTRWKALHATCYMLHARHRQQMTENLTLLLSGDHTYLPDKETNLPAFESSQLSSPM